MTKCFIDTNVLVYAKDATAPTKMAQAMEWIGAVREKGVFVVSAQSLREYYWTMYGKGASTQALASLRSEVALLDRLVPSALRVDRLADAWVLQDRYKLNFWDCLLLGAALAVECKFFLSEDLSSGQKIGTLTIINPFATTPDTVFGA